MDYQKAMLKVLKWFDSFHDFTNVQRYNIAETKHIHFVLKLLGVYRDDMEISAETITRFTTQEVNLLHTYIVNFLVSMMRKDLQQIAPAARNRVLEILSYFINEYPDKGRYVVGTISAKDASREELIGSNHASSNSFEDDVFLWYAKEFAIPEVVVELTSDHKSVYKQLLALFNVDHIVFEKDANPISLAIFANFGETHILQGFMVRNDPADLNKSEKKDKIDIYLSEEQINLKYGLVKNTDADAPGELAEITSYYVEDSSGIKRGLEKTIYTIRPLAFGKNSVPNIINTIFTLSKVANTITQANLLQLARLPTDVKEVLHAHIKANISYSFDISHGIGLNFEESCLDDQNSPIQDCEKLSLQQYICALLDLKRSADYLQVKSVKAFNDPSSQISLPDELKGKKVKAVFITGDRLAAMFSILSKQPTILVSKAKEKTTFKVYNTVRSLEQEIESLNITGGTGTTRELRPNKMYVGRHMFRSSAQASSKNVMLERHVSPLAAACMQPMNSAHQLLFMQLAALNYPLQLWEYFVLKTMS